jgi:hypothetical protein
VHDWNKLFIFDDTLLHLSGNETDSCVADVGRFNCSQSDAGRNFISTLHDGRHCWWR